MKAGLGRGIARVYKRCLVLATCRNCRAEEGTRPAEVQLKLIGDSTTGAGTFDSVMIAAGSARPKGRLRARASLEPLQNGTRVKTGPGKLLYLSRREGKRRRVRALGNATLTAFRLAKDVRSHHA